MSIDAQNLTLTLPDGTTRTLVRYEDLQGVSLLADRNALLTRYRDHEQKQMSDNDKLLASLIVAPTEILTELANAREVVSWGTHQPPGACLAVLSLTPFSAEELIDNGIKSSVEAGFLTLTGELFVCGLQTFTVGVAYAHGELTCPRVTLPEGTYRVTVHRPFSAEEEAEGAVDFLIHLERVEPGFVSERLEKIPGADGWL
jgi:hypothetical protein